MKQIHDAERKMTRQNAGLLPSSTEIKDVNKDPGLRFVIKPDIKTNTELADKAKADNVQYIDMIIVLASGSF